MNEKKKQTLRQTLRQLSVCAVVSAAIITLTLSVSANNYVQGLANIVFQNLAWVILIVGLCGAAYAAVKRNFTGALITFCVTAVLFVILLNPSGVLTSVGNVIRGALGL
jgi:hypothetical protein